MRILLIDPPGWQKHGYNLGIAYLSGALLRAKIEVKVLDLNHGVMSDREIETFLSDFQPHVIGISIKTAAYKSSIEMARKTKRICPEAIHIAGGPHVTLAYEEFLRDNREFDAAFIGESERSIVEFSNRLEAESPYDGINGVAYIGRKGKLHLSPSKPEENLESLAFPRFEPFYNVDPSQEPYHILTSRGCPHLCVFCCVHAISGRKWRFRSPENIIAELEQAVMRYGIKEFEVDDDNFTLNMDRAKEFCRQLSRMKLGLKWFCPNGIRADRLDSELALLMADTGCHSVALGIESGNQDVLKMVKKGERLEDIAKAVGYLKKAGIHTMGYFIIGLPGSTFETEIETMRYEKQIGLDDSIYNLFLPYPKTEAWEWVKQHGRFLKDYKDGYHFSDNYEFIFETKDFPVKDRMKAYLITKDKEISIRGLDIKRIEKRYLKTEAKDVLIIDLASSGGIYNDIKGVFHGAKITVLDIPNRSQYAIKSGLPAALREIERSAIPENPVLRILSAWKLFYKLQRTQFDIIILPRTLRHIIMAMLLNGRLRVIYFPHGPEIARLSISLMIKLMPGTLLYRARLILWWIARCAGKIRHILNLLDMRTLKRNCKLAGLGLRINFFESRRKRFLVQIAKTEEKSGNNRAGILDLGIIADGMRIEIDELRLSLDKVKQGETDVISASRLGMPAHRDLIKSRLIEWVRKIKEISGTCLIILIFGFSIIWLKVKRTIVIFFTRRR